MGNFACIEIRVLSVIGSLGYYKSNFRGVHNFADIYNAKISTFTVGFTNQYQFPLGLTL